MALYCYEKVANYKLHRFSMAYFRHTSNSTPSNNSFHLEKSAVCHVAIQNYSSNYMIRCSIITITTIKIIIWYCLLWFKAAIKPMWYWKEPFNKEGRLRMPRTIHQSFSFCIFTSTRENVVCSHDFHVNK